LPALLGATLLLHATGLMQHFMSHFPVLLSLSAAKQQDIPDTLADIATIIPD
jgi:hypothetical protein